MSADVQVHYYYGAEEVGGTPSCEEDIDKLRFRTIDNNDMDSDYSMRQPDSGTNYSYWKQIALVAATPPNSFINNISVYPGSTYDWVDTQIYIDQVADYDQATGTEHETGDAMTNHSDAPEENDLETYDSGSPFSVVGEIGDETGRINDGYIILQIEIGTSATIGYSGVEYLTLRYDEA